MKYSIITCTYNAEKYIHEYFDSIEKINYENFEVIIVDDFSMDDTYEIIEKRKSISKKHIVTYRQCINVGPGMARNKGIELSNGQKILFIDIDDAVSEDIFLILDKYEAECIYFDYYKWFPDKKVKCSSIQGDVLLDNIDDIMRRTNGAVWGKVFESKIIQKYGICFPPIYKTEDLVFVLRYLDKCQKIGYCKDALYYYRISETSLMNRNIEDQITNSRKAMGILKTDLLSRKDTFQIIYSKEIIYDLTNVYIRVGKERRELLEFWKDEDLKGVKWRNRKYYSRNQKIVLFLIKCRCIGLLKLINKMR